MIVNDALLTRFDEAGKRLVLQNIRNRLSLGGRYVSTARIGPPQKPQNERGYQSEENRRTWFVERAVSRFNELGGVQGFTDEDAAAIAFKYMNSMLSYRLESVDYLNALLGDCGLDLRASDVVTTAGESEETDYIRFICVAI